MRRVGACVVAVVVCTTTARGRHHATQSHRRGAAAGTDARAPGRVPRKASSTSPNNCQDTATHAEQRRHAMLLLNACPRRHTHALKSLTPTAGAAHPHTTVSCAAKACLWRFPHKPTHPDNAARYKRWRAQTKWRAHTRPAPTMRATVRACISVRLRCARLGGMQHAHKTHAFGQHPRPACSRRAAAAKASTTRQQDGGCRRGGGARLGRAASRWVRAPCIDNAPPSGGGG
jgi:hypothetical protein